MSDGMSFEISTGRPQACSISLDELVECARHNAAPGPQLASHLANCGNCRAAFADERQLSSQLQLLKTFADAQHDAGAAGRRLRKQELLRQLETQHPARNAGWMWSMATAAVLVMGIVFASPFIRTSAVSPVADVTVLSAELAAAEAEGYMPVPYASPLAMGETLTIVHADLQRAALAKLGVNVDSSWTGALPTDVLLGQDGFPRAVRVSDESVQ